MPAISAYLQKATLDWQLGGAAATQPAARWGGLAIGTPQYTGGSEMNTISGYARQTASFGPAASPQGSASNNGAMTFGPFSSVGSALGIHVWDGSPVNSSNMLWYGTLQVARTFGVGDQLVVAPGALICTLS